MTEDTILEGKPIFESSSAAAQALDQVWRRYRQDVWRKAPFELRLDNARLNREMGATVRAVVERLQQAELDLLECEKHIQDLRQTFVKLQAE